MTNAKKTAGRHSASRVRPAPKLPSDWMFSRRGDAVILQARALAEFPWLTHGFSTRVGGASERDGRRMLNLGFVEWDRPGRVESNRQKFFGALGAREMEPAALRQFHSSMVRILRRGAAGPGGRPCRGDALLTRARGPLLTVQTADCVPILLADSRKHVVAAIHAGWRGTAARIAEKAVGDLRMNFGTRPQDLWAAIGPAIGICCYEVGPDVAQEFGSQFACASEWFEGPFEPLSIGDEPTPFLWLQTDPPGHDRPKRAQLDLVAANRWQLESAGVRAQRITSCGLCTSCQNDWLFSYRREGRRTGRQMAAIGIRAEAGRS
ncbi:MAG TPA: peptidoglycan editing factor PgeF [Candidatus Dormibacteraeota bacterium]|nr:peptidoglycan editing factor PgeF [Candidatus Dormibacteraeota bacterium]